MRLQSWALFMSCKHGLFSNCKLWILRWIKKNLIFILNVFRYFSFLSRSFFFNLACLNIIYPFIILYNNGLYCVQRVDELLTDLWKIFELFQIWEIYFCWKLLYWSALIDHIETMGPNDNSAHPFSTLSCYQHITSRKN